ncbi:hypothetical protein [Vibrio breoganii]|uniref:hypothetical protein n=1 Tax=Vibrio breoganii TaxID=553239 RepID=UPI000C822319|nr:hypothetical protein [Vibrio breoganii]PML15853.1 hypothetical protein BCT84_07570 [Vibrio breoganii]
MITIRCKFAKKSARTLSAKPLRSVLYVRSDSGKLEPVGIKEAVRLVEAGVPVDDKGKLMRCMDDALPYAVKTIGGNFSFKERVQINQMKKSDDLNWLQALYLQWSMNNNPPAWNAAGLKLDV